MWQFGSGRYIAKDQLAGAGPGIAPRALRCRELVGPKSEVPPSTSAWASGSCSDSCNNLKTYCSPSEFIIREEEAYQKAKAAYDEGLVPRYKNVHLKIDDSMALCH